MIENKQLEIATQLKEYFERTGLSQQSIADRLGVSQPAVSALLNGKPFGKKLAQRWGDEFELKPNWLLTGEGEMLKSGHATASINSENDKLIPLLPTAAQGGSLNDFIMSVNGRDCERVVSPIADVDFAMPIAGDSMAPEYPAGSQILVKKINEKAFIDWGRVYVLDTCNGAVIKILIPSEKDGHVKCQSINPDPKYAPFEVAYSDIFGIYRVLLCMAIK